ncbi:MAG: hypothetical protein ABIQ15_16315 [Nocardioides sp.]
MAAETVTCDLCGRRAEEVDALAWTVATERGRLVRFCVECSRRNLRAMEGKLDSDHW